MIDNDLIPKGVHAFPFKVDAEDSTVLCTGMELRDYFAAQVMGGFIGALARDINVATNKQTLAEACYEMADAMIEARGGKE